MDTPNSGQSLPAVTAAGVVGIIFGLFGALGSALGGLSLLVLPSLPQNPNAPPMPPAVAIMSAAIMFFMFALAVAGIFVGVGVIRRRNWARITTLIWGALMTFFCLTAMAFGFVVFSAMPKLNLPNANTPEVTNVLLFMRIFMLVFYGIPSAVGIWWLVLFTRPRVAAAFKNPSQAKPQLDASGFPQPIMPAVPQVKRPTCPLPLAIVAAFLIFGAVSMVFMFAFFPLPADAPLFFFGHSFTGTAPRFITVIFGLLSGVSAVGLFKLKPWALNTQIVLQLTGLANCTLGFLSPSYGPAMRQLIQKLYANNPVFAQDSLLMSDAYLRSIMIFSALAIAIVLAIFFWQRPHFLEAAAAAEA